MTVTQPVQTRDFGSSAATLVDIRDLEVHFPVKRTAPWARARVVKAVDGVTLTVAAGETVALVGESGCGKSTLGRAVLQLVRPTGGSVRFAGTELTTLSTNNMRPLRRDMQMIFQDPYSSLDPYMMVEDIISEPMRINGVPARERTRRAAELVEIVRLRNTVLTSYPHELSGGMRQRIGIARALAMNPKFIVCDEPIAALDVSVQAQIINLLQDLQEDLGLAYLFISHDLSVVRHMADRIAVMYLGKLVEHGTTAEIFDNPVHPYTRALLSAAPALGARAVDEILLEGEIPSPLDPPTGCSFRTRCPLATEECAHVTPVLGPVIDSPNHYAAACVCYAPHPPRQKKDLT